MKPAIEISECDVWAQPGGRTARRVIALRGGAVVYSVGADKNRICKVETFRRFVRHAELIYRSDAGDAVGGAA